IVLHLETVAPEFQCDVQAVGRVVAELDLGRDRAEGAVVLLEGAVELEGEVPLALLADVAAVDEGKQPFGFDAMRMAIVMGRRRGLVEGALGLRTAFVVMSMAVPVAALRGRGQRDDEQAAECERGGGEQTTHENPLAWKGTVAPFSDIIYHINIGFAGPWQGG